VLLVYQDGIPGSGLLDPGAGRLDAADILGYRNDFKVLVLDFREEFLPAWQIESAASPGGPCYEKYLLAAKIG